MRQIDEIGIDSPVRASCRAHCKGCAAHAHSSLGEMHTCDIPRSVRHIPGRQRAITHRESSTRHAAHTTSTRDNVVRRDGEMMRTPNANIKTLLAHPIAGCCRAPGRRILIVPCLLCATPRLPDRTTLGGALPTAACEPTTLEPRGRRAPGSTPPRRRR